MKGLFSVLLLALVCWAPQSWATDLTGRASVIDGDTIDIHGQRIRGHGIDAPESSQTCQRANGQTYRCGQEAALFLSNRIGTKTVRCEQKDKDRYGRIVAVCYLGTEDLNRLMVQTGHAMAYRQYSKDYVTDEDRARAQKVGIWQGAFTPPWDYRRSGNRTASPTPSQPAPSASSSSGGFSCSVRKTCGQMSSCAEARYHLTQCGNSRLDRDHDGVPCESLCR